MQVGWEELFSALDMELEAEERAELEAEVAERTRGEVAQVALGDRLRAVRGAAVVLEVMGADTVRGVLTQVGVDWLLVTLAYGGEALISTAALLDVRGATRSAEVAGNGVGDRVRLRVLLRGLARDRREVLLTRRDGVVVTGTIDRVGADYVELAEHPRGEARRAQMVRQVRLVPVTAIAVVRAQ